MSDVLAQLAGMIAKRRSALLDQSYTRQLLDAGPSRCAKKLGEEAVEAAIAGASGTEAELKAEAADVLYHLLVLLEARRVPLSDVLAELERRMAQSGVAEKAARSK